MKRQDFSKEKTKENLLTDVEADQMKEACRVFKDELLVTILLYTGMRVSEFIHMKRSWIDGKMGLIRIPKEQPCACKGCQTILYKRKMDEETKKRVFAIVDGKKVITKPAGVWRPKTFEAVRAIPIVPEAEEIMDKFFSKHKQIMDIIPSRVHAYYRIRRIARRAGIPHPVFPHAARGTFATLLARMGFNAFEITSTMGWKDIKTAQDYIKLSGAAVKQAFKKKW